MNNPKHICVFIAFRNLDDIKTSFESLYLDTMDYFIIENKSEYSNDIENYFKDKRLRGYIQFQKNISSLAMKIFIEDFYDLLNEYDIITLTDGDLYVIDAKSIFQELVDILNKENTIFSLASLFRLNCAHRCKSRVPNPVKGPDNFKMKMMDYDTLNIKEKKKYIFNGRCFALVTFKKENLNLLKGIYLYDSEIEEIAKRVNKNIMKTNKNLVYHLTWDKYIEGNDYYEWKLKVGKNIWFIREPCGYKRIK